MRLEGPCEEGRWRVACYRCVGLLWLVLALATPTCRGYDHAKRLYDVLLYKSGYNKVVRPVNNASERIDVSIGLKLSQLIDVVRDEYYV